MRTEQQRASLQRRTFKLWYFCQSQAEPPPNISLGLVERAAADLVLELRWRSKERPQGVDKLGSASAIQR